MPFAPRFNFLHYWHLLKCICPVQYFATPQASVASTRINLLDLSILPVTLEFELKIDLCSIFSYSWRLPTITSDNQSPCQWKVPVSTPTQSQWTEWVFSGLVADHCSNTPRDPLFRSPSPLLRVRTWVSSSSPNVFMFSIFDADLVSLCIEGFFYGKISVLCAWLASVPLLKKLFLVCLGLYSGIFAMYLQRPPNKSKTYIIFYALCVLYVLSTVNVVVDLAGSTTVSNNSICKNIVL